MELTLSLVLTLLCAAIAWSTKQFKNWLITIGFGASLALCILGAVFSLAWYPWTNLIVLLVAVTGGLLLGRIMPTKLWPFLLLLLVLSMLDIVQILLTSSTPSPGSQSASAHGLTNLMCLSTGYREFVPA